MKEENIMMTLDTLTRTIRSMDQGLAPGSETDLWGDYLEDCRQTFGACPWSDPYHYVDPEFAAHWLGRYAGRECAVEAIRQLPTTEPERSEIIADCPTLTEVDARYVAGVGGDLEAAEDEYIRRWSWELPEDGADERAITERSCSQRQEV